MDIGKNELHNYNAISQNVLNSILGCDTIKDLRKLANKIVSIQILITHTICFISIGSIIPQFTYPTVLLSQIRFLLVIATLILLYINFKKDARYVLIKLLFTFVLYLVIGYPFGPFLIIDILMMINILAVIIFKLDTPFDLILSILGIAFSIIQNPFKIFGSTVFGIPLATVDNVHLTEYAFVLILVVFAYYIFKINIKVSEHNSSEIERLYTNIYRLTKMNVVFQDKAISLKAESASKERNRIIREVHDITGYYFTNILMLLKTTLLLVKQNDNKSVQLLENAIKQVLQGIDEIRRTLKILNTISSQKIASNVNSLLELTQAFQYLTDIKVELLFGNIAKTYGTTADLTIYRFVQEGLTNAFRHGRATKIEVQFWATTELLTINILDNGMGAFKFNKGMGISGMEERLSRIGGTLEAGNISDGFQISAFIPLPIHEEQE